jgi:hypothetical protein
VGVTDEVQSVTTHEARAYYYVSLSLDLIVALPSIDNDPARPRDTRTGLRSAEIPSIPERTAVT